MEQDSDSDESSPRRRPIGGIRIVQMEEDSSSEEEKKGSGSVSAV